MADILIARWRHGRWCHRRGKGPCFYSTRDPRVLHQTRCIINEYVLFLSFAFVNCIDKMKVNKEELIDRYPRSTMWQEWQNLLLISLLGSLSSLVSRSTVNVSVTRDHLFHRAAADSQLSLTRKVFGFNRFIAK